MILIGELSPVWQVVIAFIVAMPGTIAAVATLVVSLRTRKSVNGLLDARVHAARAEGAQTERDRVGGPNA